MWCEIYKTIYFLFFGFYKQTRRKIDKYTCNQSDQMQAKKLFKRFEIQCENDHKYPGFFIFFQPGLN